MAVENSQHFVHIIKEIGLMKCNTFYDDQCCTPCFDSEGTKHTCTECPTYKINHDLIAVKKHYKISHRTSSTERRNKDLFIKSMKS